MDTGIIAAVATFRAFSGRTTAPSAASSITPPSREDRMATTPVCEGPSLLSKSATNEITYLQVHNFTRAIMPRSRIWRVSEREIVIPATSSNYWLITLKGSTKLVERLNRILKGLCRYEDFSDAPPEASANGEDDNEVIGYKEIETQTEYASRPKPNKIRNRHVTDAQRIISQGDMSKRLSKVCNENLASGTTFSMRSSTTDASFSDKFSFEQSSELTNHSPSVKIQKYDRNSASLYETDSDQSTLVDGSKNEILPSSNFLESPVQLSPYEDHFMSHMQYDDSRSRDGDLMFEESNHLKHTDCDSITIHLSQPTSPELSPYPASYTRRRISAAPASLDRNGAMCTDGHGANYESTPERSYVSQQSTPSSSESRDYNCHAKSNMSMADDGDLIMDGSFENDLSTIDRHDEDVKTVIKTRYPAFASRFEPRFSHPSIPSTHISRYYPTISQNSQSHSPRYASRRQELIALGPSTLHQDVTSVGGYIGMMAVKGISRKT